MIRNVKEVSSRINNVDKILPIEEKNWNSRKFKYIIQITFVDQEI